MSDDNNKELLEAVLYIQTDLDKKDKVKLKETGKQNQAREVLPQDAHEPIVQKQEADAQPIIWLAFNSSKHSQLEVADYAQRLVKDRLQAIPGVAQVVHIGEGPTPAGMIGWDGHKMTIYWMLNSHWPSFFGNIFDYYLRPGGAYYGAKKGLRPLSVVFDSYATGNHRQGKVSVVNQTPDEHHGLRVRVRTYDLRGRVRDDRAADDIAVPKGRSAADMGGGIPVTYVPARNTLMLSLALAYGEVIGANDLYIGVNAVDYSGYPDCRPEFIAAF